MWRSEWIELHFLGVPGKEKKNLHPISPASICAGAENVIPVVKLDSEVSGSTPYCACALAYGTAFFPFFDVGGSCA